MTDRSFSVIGVCLAPIFGVTIELSNRRNRIKRLLSLENLYANGITVTQLSLLQRFRDHATREAVEDVVCLVYRCVSGNVLQKSAPSRRCSTVLKSTGKSSPSSHEDRR